MNFRNAFSRTPASGAPPPLAANQNRPAQGTKPPTHAAPRQLDGYRIQSLLKSGPLAFTLVIMALTLIGWLNSEGGYLTPEDGVGYWLGIFGGSLMLFLLIYPLRKRLKVLRLIGPVALWFRLHMLAGVIGPLLIVYHANFNFGSLNATIAMTSMLLVAFSGLIGRYLYGKLHKGLYGQRAQIRDILADATLFKQTFGAKMHDAADIASRMQRYEHHILQPHIGFLSGVWSLVLIRSESRRVRTSLQRQAKSNLAAQAKREGWTRRELRQRIRNANAYLGYYFRALNKAASYQVYVRLFSLWHILHLPLFFFLILAAIVHILAVHLY
ncbi:MAG: pyridine nucleotide-disulfide oxidoreductase [Hyphomicrobiaceae bacterium]|nr:pyridine nucleotide-disulfide oxidoreductase [Hyphomicrobiaceae bacterium]